MRDEIEAVGRLVEVLETSLARHPEPDPEPVVVHGLAGMVHDFYAGCEKAFGMVTPDLNGVELRPEAWHRDLLRAAALDLPGIRPPIVRREVAERLADYRAFRHLFRNVYATCLRPQRVRELAVGVAGLWAEVRADLERFLAFLAQACAPG